MKNDIYNAPAANLSPWNRTMCTVLDEMRKAYEHRNYNLIPSLIEEAQIYANRMEAKLTDVNDYDSMRKRYKELEKKYEKLEKKIDSKEE